MQWVEATAAHADLLAEMNRGLIVDQRSDNTMTLPKLAERMRGYFTQGWSILLFKQADVVLGYAMYRAEDEGIFLFGFYIRPEHRRAGVGRAALQALIEGPWSGETRVRLDVRVSNPAGHAFWKAMGFADRSISMFRVL